MMLLIPAIVLFVVQHSRERQAHHEEGDCHPKALLPWHD